MHREESTLFHELGSHGGRRKQRNDLVHVIVSCSPHGHLLLFNLPALLLATNIGGHGPLSLLQPWPPVDSSLIMPVGSPYHSFIRPYPIRVDEFSTPATLKTVPALHLLTHTHSDHISGLAAKSFASLVVCSADAKEMLLRHEVYLERELYSKEMRGERVRTYAHLKKDPAKLPDGTMVYTNARYLLVSCHCILYDGPKLNYGYSTLFP